MFKNWVPQRVLPKANNATILSYDYVEKTRALLEEFGPLPIINFAAFWRIKYDECIDFVALKYEGGLCGFLRDNDHLFEITKNDRKFWLVSLISRPVSRNSNDSGEGCKENVSSDSIGKNRPIKKAHNRLFNETSFLWADKPWSKFLKQNVQIATSAYESAYQNNESQTKAMVDKMRRILRKLNLGLKVNELYQHIDTVQALKLFKVSTSIVALIDELPEIFYREKINDSGEDYIFDATTRTISDLTGQDDELFEGGPKPELIATRALNEGLYQKTLLLIRDRGVKGLKINVWMKSMQRSFYAKNDDAFERDFKGINTLTFFLALARYELLELKSHEEIKNDIIAHLPRKYIDFMDLKSKLLNLNNLDSNSEEFESNGEECHDCEPANQHVAEVKSILKSKQN
jgi:hypothetical protein